MDPFDIVFDLFGISQFWFVFQGKGGRVGDTLSVTDSFVRGKEERVKNNAKCSSSFRIRHLNQTENHQQPNTIQQNTVLYISIKFGSSRASTMTNSLTENRRQNDDDDKGTKTARTIWKSPKGIVDFSFLFADMNTEA